MPTTSAIQLEQVFEAVPDGVLVTNRELALTHMNSAAEHLLGRFATESLGLPLSEVLQEGGDIVTTIAAAVGEGRSLAVHEVDWPDGDHPPVPVDIHITPLWNRPGEVTGAVLVFRDLRTIKKLEEEKRQVDRLAMMGTIATGLAHEIKNPLAGIHGAGQLLGRKVQNPEAAELIDIILKESERVSRLIGDLLTLARPRLKSHHPTNVNEVLDRLLKLFESNLTKAGITTTLHLDPSLPLVETDDEGLTQVFENLLTNAIEAMPEGGHLTLASRWVSEYQIRTEGGRGARFMEVEFTDTGVGMDADTLTRIFTPFFTTKAKGTGLGLAMAQRIVLENNGKIKIKSQRGKGSTMTVILKGVTRT